MNKINQMKNFRIDKKIRKFNIKVIKSYMSIPAITRCI